ncbi:MAG: sulfurtransferase TusA family protein [Cellvibrionaceae bacterium]|nr:sulfurtransferase TusA family protein [Cellvibrionaceae bacterium]
MTSDFHANPPEDSDAMSVQLEVDATGLRCPLPLLKAKQALNNLKSGERVKVTATDAGSVRDFHAFAQLSGNPILCFTERAGVYEYIVQKR